MVRRRSPQWVRAMSSQQLHSIGGKLQRERFEGGGISDRQEALWDAVISELEYRRRRSKSIWDTCSCQLCVSPFPEDLLPAR